MSKMLKIKRPIRSIVVHERQAFNYSIAYGFEHSTNGKIEHAIYLGPSWIDMNGATGIIHGNAPKIQGSHEQFLITVIASINNDTIKQDFFIRVVNKNMIEDITRFLLQLHCFPFTPEKEKHDVLDFIFEYYRVSVYKNDFMHLLRDHAEEKNITLPSHDKDIEYQDFKEVVEAFHPDIEKELQEKLEEEHILSEAELSRQEMSDLFREGAEPLGVIPVVVWNYLGEASYHNWSEIKSVLHEAVHAIRELHEHVQDSQMNFKPTKHV